MGSGPTGTKQPAAPAVGGVPQPKPVMPMQQTPAPMHGNGNKNGWNNPNNPHFGGVQNVRQAIQAQPPMAPRPMPTPMQPQVAPSPMPTAQPVPGQMQPQVAQPQIAQRQIAPTGMPPVSRPETTEYTKPLAQPGTGPVGGAVAQGVNPALLQTAVAPAPGTGSLGTVAQQFTGATNTKPQVQSPYGPTGGAATPGMLGGLVNNYK